MPSKSDDNTRGLLTSALTLALTLRPGSSARKLVELFQDDGLDITGTQVNSVLYSRIDRFWSVGSKPPLWQLISGVTSSPEPQLKPPHDKASSPFALYAWQSAALSAWRGQSRRGVVEAVTGTGKTLVGLAAAWEELEEGGKVQVLVPSVDLLNQWAELVQSHIPNQRSGLLGGGNRDRLEDVDILVAVVNSAREVKANTRGKHALLIADECHRYATERNAQALDEDIFDSRLGLSATYARLDDGHLDILDPFFGGTCYEFDYEDALRHEVTAHYKVALVAVRFNDEEQMAYEEVDEQARRHRGWLINNAGVRAEPFRAFMQDVTNLGKGGYEEETARARMYLHAFSLRRQVLAQTEATLDFLDDLASAIRGAERVLVFTERTESAEKAAERIREHGLSAVAIHSKLKLDTRKSVLAQFARGSISVLCAPRVLDEGVDVPAADLGIILAASQSQRQMIQRMGRLLRRKADGRYARFVISYVQGTSEDPDSGAHETFLENLTNVASDIKKYDGTEDTDDICHYLNDYRWQGQIPPPRMDD